MKKIIIGLIIFGLGINSSFANTGDLFQNINFNNPLELVHSGTINHGLTQFELYFWDGYSNEQLGIFLSVLATALLIFFFYVEFSKTFRL